MDAIGKILSAIIWIVGIILAHGFWSTFFAVICPLYGLYLIIEKYLTPFL
jgi:predicted PurR-regulated permease PerM